ncbi:MAG: 4Fe-4S binding protein [Candidatus Bipolaricaulota bacterium]|nr:4Fe-4S binding protein [Candidatus Bipolaricaulota bacterium]
MQAYKIGTYALLVEPKRCKGCGLCVYSCPKQILFLNGSGKIAVKEIEPCIFCRICEMRCPDFAIWVEKALTPGPSPVMTHGRGVA